MKKFFKDWSIFELILLLGSPLVILVVGIVFKSDALTMIASIVGIMCALFLAKGLVLGQFLGIAIVILYSIVSYKNGFYGELLIYLVIMLPMYIWGIVEWLKHKNGETKSVEVNSIKWKEWLIVSLCSVALFVGGYFLLKALNTNELIVSTLSIVDNIFAVYLLARRSKYGFISYIINDLILIALWGIPVIQGNWLLLPMLINPIVNLINDTYGVINWTRMQKSQKEQKHEEQEVQERQETEEK